MFTLCIRMIDIRNMYCLIVKYYLISQHHICLNYVSLMLVIINRSFVFLTDMFVRKTSFIDKLFIADKVYIDKL